MADRELRAALEAAQHEVRALTHELSLDEGPEFTAKRPALEMELALVRSRAQKLASQAKESGARLASELRAVAASERALREREQKNLSLFIALLAMAIVGVSAPYIGELPVDWLAGLSGLGLGWLMLGRRNTAAASEEPIVEADTLLLPNAALSTVLPIAMFLCSPLVFAMQASAHRFNDSSELARMSAGAVFVLLAGAACRVGRRGVLLACAMIEVGALAALAGKLSLAVQLDERLANQWAAAAASCFALPAILSGLWLAASKRGHVVWKLVSSALLVGSAIASWWLMTSFVEERPLPFTSFAGLALELALAAGFFALAAAPGFIRRILLAVSAFFSVWVILVFAVLLSMRYAIAM